MHAGEHAADPKRRARVVACAGRSVLVCLREMLGMKLSNPWVLLLAGVMVAAAAASCSATAENRFTSATSSGAGASGSGTSSGAGGTSGTGLGGAISGHGGGIQFGDGGPGDAAPDQGGGPTTCDASCSAAGGTCMMGTCVLSDNPGKVDPGTQGKLMGGGTADPAFAWLYPYDQTVFPRGLLPPKLQFAGTAPTAVFVHVTFPGMDYKGWYGASSPGSVTFAAPVWKAISLAALAGIDVKVDVTKISGTSVAGPITETWSIAQGSLRGTIYYETYDSVILGGIGSVGIMKIQPGAASPTMVKSGCGNVCHTASADGSTLVANAGFFLQSASYDLTNNASTIFLSPATQFTYGGIYPDGSFVVSATNYRTWLGAPSHLYETKMGTQLPTPSWDNAVKLSGTPAFSPDGKQIAFIHEDKDNGAGHWLSAMDYDHGTKTFSGFHDIANDPASTLAWPAFTPDGKWVVYHAGSNNAFETDSGATGDLFVTSAAGPKVTRLDALDGYKAGGGNYLPANDPKLSFAPTVLPEAVGGYYWVVFTSHRSYGNTLPSLDGPSGSPGEYGKLWVAAFDINAVAGKDPSHPAFFLDGQEIHSDNLRGFWVLDPCKQTSNDCTSGDECCTGYCRSEDGGPTQCVPPPMNSCSNEYEKCTTAADCCDPSYQCINGFCARPPAK